MSVSIMFLHCGSLWGMKVGARLSLEHIIMSVSVIFLHLWQPLGHGGRRESLEHMCLLVLLFFIVFGRLWNPKVIRGRISSSVEATVVVNVNASNV